jgi:adenylate cyclase
MKDRAARAAAAVRAGNRDPRVLRAVRVTRGVLPGDAELGDELSTAQGRPSQVLARHLRELGVPDESAARELGLTTLQVWQALSRATGRGAGAQAVAIVFTDIVGFSSFVLERGDDLGVELLRAIEAVVGGAVKRGGGRVVKHLGDGHMAVFPDAARALDAALELQREAAALDVGGSHPRLRAGVHLGRPRRVGDDFLGADVNVAARLAQAGDGDRVLVSEAVLSTVDADGLDVRRHRRFRAKGVPSELEVFAVRAG